MRYTRIVTGTKRQALFGRVFFREGIPSLGKGFSFDFLASKWTDEATPR
jgi:hypothetical protein